MSMTVGFQQRFAYGHYEKYRAHIFKSKTRQRWNSIVRITKYFVIPLVLFLTLIGRPKIIFRCNWHIPWLTNVQHVQPLMCVVDEDQPGWPKSVQSVNKSLLDGYLTIAIVTARSDFKRLPLALASLACHADHRRLSEIILLVPRRHAKYLEPFLTGQTARHWPWPISVMPDDILLKHSHTHSYRLQMMFKLVLAQIVKTEYYMILDADCVALWPIHVEQLLWEHKDSTSNKQRILPAFKALYQLEERSDHAEWWPESEELLMIPPNTCVADDPSMKSMGVTPAILSRSIASRTLCRLQSLYGDQDFLNKLANWALWRTPFGRMWTEYTLYYLTARCTKLFNQHHFYRTNTSSVPSINLYGPSVWWQTDWTSFLRNHIQEAAIAGLTWRQKEIDQQKGAPLTDLPTNVINLFTVLQSRVKINQTLFHNLLYPLFMDHLKQRHDLQQLVNVLNQMTAQFVSG